ncbi:MAG TPA: hypothetical protein PK600_06810 [Deltaproteobacteria bacterium]|nr:hypothetical protein [Deltaproteobacteria bacterium]
MDAGWGLTILGLSVPFGAAILKFVPAYMPGEKETAKPSTAATEMMPRQCPDHRHLVKAIGEIKRDQKENSDSLHEKLNKVANDVSKLCGYIEGKDKQIQN